MELSELVQWGFQLMITTSVMIGVKKLSVLTESVNSLNIQMGKVVVRDEWHSKMIDDLDDRVKKIELSK